MKLFDFSLLCLLARDIVSPYATSRRTVSCLRVAVIAVSWCRWKK